jgi:hypothetical protein
MRHPITFSVATFIGTTKLQIIFPRILFHQFKKQEMKFQIDIVMQLL